MKKRKWLLLLILCIGLCGCGKENGQQDDFTAVGGEMEEAMDGNMLTLSILRKTIALISTWAVMSQDSQIMRLYLIICVQFFLKQRLTSL